MRALVTGAGHRLGQAMAVYLAGRGYDVAVHFASSDKGALETVAQVEAKGQRGVRKAGQRGRDRPVLGL